MLMHVSANFSLALVLALLAVLNDGRSLPKRQLSTTTTTVSSPQWHPDASTCSKHESSPAWNIIAHYPPGTIPPIPDPALDDLHIVSAVPANSSSSSSSSSPLTVPDDDDNNNPLCHSVLYAPLPPEGSSGTLRLEPFGTSQAENVHWFVSSLSSPAIISVWTKPITRDPATGQIIPSPGVGWQKRTLEPRTGLSQAWWWFYGNRRYMFDLVLDPSAPVTGSAEIYWTAAVKVPEGVPGIPDVDGNDVVGNGGRVSDKGEIVARL